MGYKIGIFTTHPIQYKAPWYRALSAREDVDLTVFYCMIPDAQQQGDGFGVAFEWDIPLLDGYKYEVLENVAREPAVTSFRGCDTPGILSIVRDRGFDAFIVNGWVVKACLQLLWACRRSGVPCIVRGESNALRPRVWWKRMVHRMLLKQYAAYLAIGQSNRDFYLQNGVAERDVFLAPYSVDNDRFERAAEQRRPERAAIRAEWQIPADAFVFLFCAKFIDKKRPADLLEAAAAAQELAPGRAGIHVLMVGDGELKPDCQRLASDRRVAATFTGFLNQSDIVRAYVAADCLVLPSDYGETWGLVVNEAMACGLPAIVSDRVGCGPDLIVAGETGDTFAFADCRALAELLIQYASGPASTQRMGQAARERVRGYSADTVVKGTLDAVAHVCGHPELPR